MIETLKQLLAVDSWLDLLVVLIDVGIVTYIVYRILLLIKGTRAVQVLIGLISIIVFFFASKEEYLHLPTLNWLLDKFIGSFILIAVVVFQDDIRRGLSQVGRTSLFSNTESLGQETHVLEEAVKASVMLSNRKIGALIVLEREADLKPYTTEGIALDARVSKELLFSSFLTEHQNPLHDGAVIIQGDIVVAAGCFLPLSNSPKIDKTLGTRHRAALGLSEETDAAVIVVSEETGIISVAYREQLIRGLDASRLREVLHKIFSYSRADGEDEPERLSRLKTLLQSLGRGDNGSRAADSAPVVEPEPATAAVEDSSLQSGKEVPG